MASFLWGYWGNTPEPKFPLPPTNPLAFISPDHPEPIVSAYSHSFNPQEGHSSPIQVDTQDLESENSMELEESSALEEIAFSIGPSALIPEDNPAHKLAVKRSFARELVSGAIGRWREALTWIPTDVPLKLELSPIVAQYVPYYAFYAEVDCSCSGNYDVETGNGREETSTEIVFKDELNEILVCATTDFTPNLLEELFDAKAFLPPPSTHPNQPHSTPIHPRHPFHTIRYRDHLYSSNIVQNATVSRPDINMDLAVEMIRDYLARQAGPFLGEQEFKLRFGIESRNIKANASVRTMKCYILYLPIYTATYTYHDRPYSIIVSGINGAVAAQRMSWGTGQIGRALSSVKTGISKIVSNNI